MAGDRPDARPDRTAEPLLFRLTAPRRLLLALGVILCVTYGAQVRVVMEHEGRFYPGGEVPVGADFFVFYSVGKLVAGGDGDQLYDLARQHAEQVRVLQRPDFEGFLPFAYPAFFAAPFVPLAALPFFWAYAVLVGLLVGAAFAAVALLSRVSPTARERPLLVALVVVTSQPLVTATFGGLAPAYSLLCLAGSYVALRRSQDAMAGVWLGLLLYKPQLSGPMLLLMLWNRRWRTVAVAAATGVALALVGVAIAGPEWPRRFLQLTGGTFYEMEAESSGHNLISFLGVAEQLFGVKTIAAWGIAAVLGLVAATGLLWAWRGARPAARDFPLQYGFAVAVVVLVSPHALFYEVSLLTLPILLLVDHWRLDGRGVTPARRLMLISFYAAGFCWPVSAFLDVQPLAPLPIIVGVLTWRALGRGDVADKAGTNRRVSNNQGFLGGFT